MSAKEVSSKSSKSKKRDQDEKPSKRKRAEVENAEDGQAEEVVPKKHKSVLSKFKKSAKIAESTRENAEAAQEADEEAQPELHDLTPLPQPPKVRDAAYNPQFSALPSWLTAPVTVPSKSTTPFGELGIDPKLVDQLKKKGYEKAFAVQAACLPLLLPGPRRHLGDVCVSAATGSGKTLAYILPMVESLKNTAVTKLRGLIVVPTRELVAQARETAQQCAAGTGLKIGTAIGNRPFAEEQELLVKKGRKYAPRESAELHEKARQKLLSGNVEKDQYLEDAIKMLPNFVPQYEFKVDILICTPGRLVEHIRSTTGFHLGDIQWLVIDEADRLLDQSFQEWVEVLMGALEAEKPEEEWSVRRRVLTSAGFPQEKREIMKVILSATMTRDLGKLASLKLRRPRLVTVEGDNDTEQNLNSATGAGAGETFELPATLKEWAISVGDGADKPLYLLQLLQQRIFPGTAIQNAREKEQDSASSDSESDDGSDSDDSSSSESSSDSDSSDASTSSGESTDEDSSDSDSSSGSSVKRRPSSGQPKPSKATVTRVLIFTNNNENASRLAHLLATLHPPYGGMIATLTKSAATSAGRKVLASFKSGKISILIASDRASRGLDVPELAHVVNYDIPHGITSYVHRVGRTARAGKAGEAWTFFTRIEARWFWNAIARAPEIKRGDRKVERVNIDMTAVTEERRKMYEAALKDLQRAVEGAADK